MRRSVLEFTVIAAVGSCGLAVALPAAASPEVAAPASVAAPPWGAATQVPGMAALPDQGGNAQVSAISCRSSGYCTAVGNYGIEPGRENVFTVAKVKGKWQAARQLPVPAGLDATIVHVNAVSCASAGNCAAGGFYDDTAGDRQAFVASEVNGAWQEVIEVLSTEFLTDENAEVLSVSCPSPGNCVIGGDYVDGSGHRQPFVGSQQGGAWDAAIEVPGIFAMNAGGAAQVVTVSCATTGNCAAGGYYTGGHGQREAFVVSEKGGTWANAREVAGRLNTNGFAQVSSVSCPSPGNCAAGGVYTIPAHGGMSQAFVVSQAKGTWGNALEMPGTGTLNAGGDGAVSSVSCPSAGNCEAGGYYLSRSAKYEAFAAGEQGGVWHAALEVPGTDKLNATGQAQATQVSCVSPGNCALVGSYQDKSHHTQAFVAGEAGGRWSTAAEIPGTASLNKGGDAAPMSVSCASVTSCAAGGFYAATPAIALGFLVSGALPQTSRSALTLSAAMIVYGHEQSERITVTVSPQHSGTPTGTVTVSSGNVVVCAIALASGKGRCALSARKLAVGKHSLIASYPGSVAFTGSASAGKTVTVIR